MGFIEFVAALVIGLVLDLIAAAVCLWIFSFLGIPFLDALSYWQVFGLSIAFSIMSWNPRISD